MENEKITCDCCANINEFVPYLYISPKARCTKCDSLLKVPDHLTYELTAEEEAHLDWVMGEGDE